jgi:DNA-binding transcriptional ArsR family regulator
MPDEFEFENYSDFKTIEDFSKSVEGSKYYHDLYLKAVNHPIRREILKIVNDSSEILETRLFNQLSEKKILKDPSILEYNVNFLIKALCIEKVERGDRTYYVITQAGKVVDYLK